MNEIDQNRAKINKACQETFNTYTGNQLVEAIRQLGQNQDPTYFTKKENKQNMRDIPFEEVSKYILSSILTATTIKRTEGYNTVLTKTTDDPQQMSTNDVEIILEDMYDNKGIEATFYYVHNNLLTGSIMGTRIIETFVQNRYNTISLGEEEFINYEVDNPTVIGINNEIYSIGTHKKSSETKK